MSELIDREAVREFIKSYRHSTDVAFDMEKHLDEIHAAPRWHRVEEPPKDACDCLVCWTTIHDAETGEVTGHGFWCEKGWYEDGLLGDVGFYCQRREETHPVRVEPDYWMPIEPPKEDA